jgi:hypothetical protein
MIRAVYEVDSIEPWRCRQHVAEHFDAHVMFDKYLRAYDQILAREMEPLVAPPVAETLAGQPRSSLQAIPIAAGGLGRLPMARLRSTEPTGSSLEELCKGRNVQAEDNRMVMVNGVAYLDEEEFLSWTGRRKGTRR